MQPPEGLEGSYEAYTSMDDEQLSQTRQTMHETAVYLVRRLNLIDQIVKERKTDELHP